MRKTTPGVAVGIFVLLTAVAGLSRGEPSTDPVRSDVRETADAGTAASRRAASSGDTPLLRVDTGAAESAGLDPVVLDLALGAVRCAVAGGDIARPSSLTIIDYSRPSIEPRLWVFDTTTGTMLYRELVAHGRNTGENMAARFSDTLNSRQSSLGLFVTGETYVGSNGYSLRLDGLEPGFNARARERAIVMHGAAYVDPEMARRQGRLGRSWGCPALREAIARDVINTIRDGGVVFSYYPDRDWLSLSRFLNGCGDDARPMLARAVDRP